MPTVTTASLARKLARLEALAAARLSWEPAPADAALLWAPRPTNLPQCRAYESPADTLGYGGAAGGVIKVEPKPDIIKRIGARPIAPTPASMPSCCRWWRWGTGLKGHEGPRRREQCIQAPLDWRALRERRVRRGRRDGCSS